MPIYGQGLTAVALLLPVLYACDGSTSEFVTERSDSAGIELLTYRGPDVPLDWQFVAAFSLGGKETGEESFYSLSPEYVSVDGVQNIYVLDQASNRVVVFDSGGSVVRTVGGEGSGPGEMRFPFALGVSQTGVVSVFDISKRGLVRFGPDGEVLEEVRISFPYGGGPIVDRGESMIIPSQELDIEESTYTDALLEISGDDTLRIVSHTRPAGGSITLESCGMRLAGIAPVFSPTMRWSPIADGVVLATSAHYEIAVYEADSLVRVIRRTIEPHPATRADAVESIGDGMRVSFPGGVRVCDPEEVVEQRGFANVVPVIGELAAGPQGTVWVMRSVASGAPALIDVFDAEGTYQGTVPEGSPLPVAVIGDRIAAIENDDNDIERLVIYRIAR